MIDKSTNIFIISMLVFVVLNIIENLIYFNNGKFGTDKDIDVYFTLPNFSDFLRIISIMLIFAFAQGILTVCFTSIA